MNNYTIYFSPTGGTEKVIKLLAAEFGDCTEIDLSKKDAKDARWFERDDLCIIGVPSYGGRVPAIALERMENYRGKATKAILVAVYGNRAYEDTLAELYDFLAERGFLCVAAIAAIAEHSIMHQFARKRPDNEDAKELAQYAKDIKAKLANGGDLKNVGLPGNRPYKEYHGVPLKPKANKKCTNCGKCVKSCPVGAISVDTPAVTDKNVCISCMRCVSICPVKARNVSNILVKVASLKMKKECEQRKNNKLFIE